MTARTLEEIEAEYAKGRGNGAPHMAPLGVMIDNFPCLLAIAQEQRAEIARLKRAIIAANRGVIAGEGVGLAYYMENCYGVEDSPAESVEVIHQVTGE